MNELSPETRLVFLLNIAKLIDETNDEEAKDALKKVMQALVMSLISIKSTKQEIH
jgi:hypothetical protein